MAEQVLSDEILYERCFSGDREAASVLVERYGDRLTFYINGYLKDLQEAEDLMIECFSLLLLKKRSIYRSEGAFRAYLYRTARNLAIRAEKKKKLRFLSFEELTFEPESGLTAESPVFAEERNAQLYGALSKINADYREALYLVFLEGLSYTEAGRIMGKTEKQITRLIFHGKHALKKELEIEGFEYAEY